MLALLLGRDTLLLGLELLLPKLRFEVELLLLEPKSRLGRELLPILLLGREVLLPLPMLRSGREPLPEPMLRSGLVLPLPTLRSGREPLLGLDSLLLGLVWLPPPLPNSR